MTRERTPAEADRDRRAASVDLLGVLAYGKIAAFALLSAESVRAPRHDLRVALAEYAVAEFADYELLAARVRSLGVDPAQAVAPFRAAVDDFHARTAPSSWVEGLVRAYIGDGIAVDFFAAVSAFLDPAIGELVEHIGDHGGRADFAIAAVREAVEGDPALAARLSLWGRRLVGEAVTQVQQMAAQRDPLARLLVGDVHGAGTDLGELGRIITSVTDTHQERLRRLGLSA